VGASKKLGDEIPLPDGRGGTVRLKLVACLSGSIWQGALLVDEAAFERIFPNVGGYRVLLMDVPKAESGATRALLDTRFSGPGIGAGFRVSAAGGTGCGGEYLSFDLSKY